MVGKKVEGTELEGTDTPDLGPRFEEKPRL
jgi:hypothetical protein